MFFFFSRKSIRIFFFLFFIRNSLWWRNGWAMFPFMQLQAWKNKKKIFYEENKLCFNKILHTRKWTITVFDQQVTNCRGGFTFVVKSLNNKFLTVNITNFVKFRVFYVTFNHLLVHLLVGYSWFFVIYHQRRHC